MLLEVAQGQACPCPGRTRSLAECIGMSEGKACARAPFAARAILRALGRGEQPKKIAPRLLERFGPVDPEVVKLDRAPCRGKKDAPATLVVISDFQCLYCAMGKKLVEELERRAKERLRVCFLNWPLTKIHPLAKGAARAAVAAQLQGKFWPMHDLLFENRGELQREDLLSHAKEIGLDLARFEKDMDSAAVEARVELDITEARRLRMRGTPAFLINGRRYTDPKSPDDFMDWIEEAEATGVGEGLAPSRAGTSPAPTN